MGLAGTVALHSLLGRPGRTLFSVLGIALGIATVVAVVVLDHNTILGLSAPFQRKGTPDIELRAAPGSATESLHLADIEGVSLLARTFQHEGVARPHPLSEVRRAAGQQRRITLMAIEATHAAEFGVYELSSGRHLDPDAEGREVLIGSDLATFMELSEGDTIWLSRAAKPGRKRCVDGVLVTAEGPPDRPVEYDFEIVGILTNEKFGRRSGGMVTVVDFEWGEEVYRGAHVDRRWWGVRDQDVDVERLKASLAHSYSYQLGQAAILGQAADERAFRTGVRMAGLLALILGLYVIFHTLSMSLTERIGEVGTLHALGCTRAQVARIFLLEALALAGAGAALGILGGIALARLMLAVGITTLGTGKHVNLFLVPWDVVLALAALGFGIAMAGSVYPLVSLRGASAVHALRGDAPLEKHRLGRGFQLLYAFLLVLVLPAVYLTIVPVVGNLTAELNSILLGAFALLAFLMVLSMVVPTILSTACTILTQPFVRYWPLSGLLTTRAMRAAPARIGVSMSSLALVTAGLVGLKGMTRSLQAEVKEWASEAVQDKVWVRNMPPTDFDRLAEHLHEYGALGVEKGEARIYSPFLVMGVEVAELAGYGPCAEDPELLAALAGGRGILISRRLAAELSYSVGETVQIARRDGQVERLPVLAISDAYGHYPFPDERMYGLIADDLMEKWFCVDVNTVDEVAVRMPPGTDVAVVESAIEAFHSGPHEINYRSGAEVLDDHVADIQRDFILFDILLALTATLAGLGMLNGQLLAALERTKEFGVLKALGTSRRQVTGTILLEAAVVGLGGGLLGVAAGSLLTPAVISSVGRLSGLSLVWVGAGAWLWVGLLGALGVALGSALYPVWRINREDAVQAVRTG